MLVPRLRRTVIHSYGQIRVKVSKYQVQRTYVHTSAQDRRMMRARWIEWTFCERGTNPSHSLLQEQTKRNNDWARFGEHFIRGEGCAHCLKTVARSLPRQLIFIF